MPDAADYGSYAADLTNQPISGFNQVVMHQQGLAQQNKLRQDAIDERNQNREDRQREIRDRYQAGLLQKYGEADYRTPVQKVNDIMNQNTGDILRQFSTDPTKKNLSDAEFAAQLQQAFMPTIQAHRDLTNKAAVETNAINQLASQHKQWFNKEQAQNDMLQHLNDNYIIQDDGKGFKTFKPVNPMDMNHSDIADIVANDKTGRYFNPDALQAYYESIKKGATQKNDYNVKFANGDIANLGGETHPGLQDVNVKMDGRNEFATSKPTVSIKSVPNRVDKYGNPITVLPEEAFTQHIIGNPFQQQAFNYINNHASTAPDGTRLYDPNDKDEQLALGHKIATDALGGTGIIQKGFVKNPPKQSININTGKDVPVINAYKQVGELMGERNTLPLNEAPAELQSYLVNKADDLNKDKNYSHANTVIYKHPDGTITLNEAVKYQGKNGESMGVGGQILKLDPTGVNLAANKGGGTKVHNKVVSQSISPNPATSPVGSSLTPEQWNASWAKLPKGATMVGLDGKTYKK